MPNVAASEIMNRLLVATKAARTFEYQAQSDTAVVQELGNQVASNPLLLCAATTPIRLPKPGSDLDYRGDGCVHKLS